MSYHVDARCFFGIAVVVLVSKLWILDIMLLVLREVICVQNHQISTIVSKMDTGLVMMDGWIGWLMLRVNHATTTN